MPMPVVGQALRVFLGKERKEIYRSRVVDLSKTHFIIDLPLHRETHVAPRLLSGDEIGIEYVEKDGALCRFSTQFIELTRSPGLSWVIARPKTTEIIREQRRDFVRVLANFPVHLAYKTESEHEYEVDVHSRDISGGGLAIWIPKEVSLRAGIVVTVSFVLPNPEMDIKEKCFVIRVGDRNEFQMAPVSLQFTEIRESVRQKVIQYTFYRQRLGFLDDYR